MGLTNFPNGITSFGVPVLPNTSTGSGSVFWVDSGDSLGSDNPSSGTFEKPFSTIDYAVGKCTANNGDTIYVKTGHTETVSAAAGLALDVAGITIIFLGEGNARGSISFGTVVGADMNVDAADITLINPRFVAAIDALTGPIDVNSARFKMYNATWQDGTSINTTDCVVADANADDMTIDGFEFIDGNAAGTQKQSFIQIAGATRPVLKNIRCTGDFGTGVVENGTAWIDAWLEDLVIDNASASPTVCILLQATSSGQARNCHLRVASGTTYVTADNDMQWFECFGTGTDATAGEKIGTQLAGDIEAKVDVIDSYHDVPTADVTTNTVLRDVVGNKSDAAVNAVGTTKTIMAYAKGIVNEITVPTADVTDNGFMNDVVGNKTDAAATVGTTKTIMANVKQVTNQGQKLDAAAMATSPTAGSFITYLPRSVEKSDGAVLNGTTDDLFTISGGPVRCKIVGLVTTAIGGAANMSLQHTTTAPAATVELNAAPVAITSDAAGTIYTNIGATSVFTPSTGLGFVLGDPVTVEEVEFILAPGTVKALGSASQTGVIKWYMTYWPLSPNSLVVAAA